MRSVGEDDCSDLARKVLSVVMERDDLKKYYDLLETDEKSPPVRIRKAFVRKALRNHPDKHPGEPTEFFQRVCAAYWKACHRPQPMPSCDKIFFGCVLDLRSDVKVYKLEMEDLFDSEEQFRVLEEIVQNISYALKLVSVPVLESSLQPARLLAVVVGSSWQTSRRKMGKFVPAELTDGEIAALRCSLKESVVQQPDKEIFDDPRKAKQKPKVTGAPAVVAKPKPKSKKQLQADQRRREKEMAEIATQLEEKAKLDEEKAEQRKQAEAERQKKKEEERAKQAAETKRRERDAKEKQSEMSRRKRDREPVAEQSQQQQQPRRRETKDREDRRQEKQVQGKKEESSRAKRKQTQKQSQQDGGHRQPPRQAAPRRQQQQQQQQQMQQLSSRSQYEVPPRFRQRQLQQQQTQQQQQQQDGSRNKDASRFQNGDEFPAVDGLDRGCRLPQPMGQTDGGMDTVDMWESETGESTKEDQLVGDSDGTEGSLNGSAHTVDLLRSGLTDLREPSGPISDTASLLTSCNWTPQPTAQTGSLTSGVAGAWSVNGTASWESASGASGGASQTDVGMTGAPTLSSQAAWRTQKPDREKGDTVNVWNKTGLRQKGVAGTAGSDEASGPSSNEEELLRHLLDMGFQEGQALKALRNNPSNFEGALGDLLAISAVEEQNAVEHESSGMSPVRNVFGPTVNNDVPGQSEPNQALVEVQEQPSQVAVEEHTHTHPVHSEKFELPRVATAEPSSVHSGQGQVTATSLQQVAPIQPLLQQLLLQLQLQQLTPQILASQLMALQQSQERESKTDSSKNDTQQVAPLLPGAQLLLQQQQQQQQLSWLLSLVQGFQGLPNPLAMPQLPGGPMPLPPQGLPQLLQQLQQTQQVQDLSTLNTSESNLSGNSSQGNSRSSGGTISQANSGVQTAGDQPGNLDLDQMQGPPLLKFLMGQNSSGSNYNDPQTSIQQDIAGPSISSPDGWPSFSSDLLSKRIDSVTSGKNPWAYGGLTAALSSLGSHVSESVSRLEMPSVGEPPVDIQLDFLASPDDVKTPAGDGRIADSTHWSLTDKSVAHIGPPAFEPGKIWPGLSGDELEDNAELEEEMLSLQVKPQNQTSQSPSPLTVQPPPKTTLAPTQLPIASGPRKWSSGKDGPSQAKGPLLATPLYPPSLPPTVAAPRPLAPFGAGLPNNIPFPIPTDFSGGNQKQGILGAPPPLASGSRLPGSFPVGFPGMLMPAAAGRLARPPGIPKSQPKSVASVRPASLVRPQPTLSAANSTGKLGPVVTATAAASLPPTPWASHSAPQSAVSSPKKSPVTLTTTSGKPEITTISEQRPNSAPGSPKLRTSWVLLKNIPKQFNMDMLRSVCQQHGPVKAFECNSHNGTALVKYGSSTEAEQAKPHLHMCMLGGGPIAAQLVGDTDLALFYEQLPAAPVARSSVSDNTVVSTTGISRTLSPPGTADKMKFGDVLSVSSLKAGLAGIPDVQSSVPSFGTKTDMVSDPLAGLGTKMWPRAGSDGLPAVSSAGLSGPWSSGPTNTPLNPWNGSLDDLPGKIGGGGGSTYSQTISGSIYGGDSA